MWAKEFGVPRETLQMGHFNFPFPQILKGYQICFQGHKLVASNLGPETLYLLHMLFLNQLEYTTKDSVVLR